ncbi:dUTPase [Virgibacillus phasianinus]|uniref:dUTPase n=1 Tax=Virgibacillus phasianinus TaxID=2017483 RepID=A0A220U4B8_9BACI|nr:dUTP diphosphatase [Virgibacillus phasianinus]ASK63008.1 dUTPase [Virgibacillus phasianinus]
MNWEILFSMQNQLDRHIEKKHHVEQSTLFESKYLALLVEIGELANETRCFKFWSTKAPSDGETILEEYVDGLHFILSLGIEKGYKYESSENYQSAGTVTEQFNRVFRYCVQFHENTTEENYRTLFESFLALGKILDFDEKSIMDGYKKKNDKNYLRQEQGY